MSTPTKKKPPTVKVVAKKKARKPRKTEWRGKIRDVREVLGFPPEDPKETVNWQEAYHKSCETVRELRNELRKSEERPLPASGDTPSEVVADGRPRSEKALGRLSEELNRLGHYSDLIDGKLEAINGLTSQSVPVDTEESKVFLKQLEIQTNRLQAYNERIALMFDHLCQII